MWVEVVKSIALKPTRSSSGATVSVLAVSMPRALHRLWLPSRSEVSTSAISATLPPARDAQQRLAVLDRRTILDQDLDHGAAHLGTHAVHELHHFDDPDDGVFLHLGSHLDVRGGARPRRAVEDTEERRGNLLERRVARGPSLLALRLELRCRARSCPGRVKRSRGRPRRGRRCGGGAGAGLARNGCAL